MPVWGWILVTLLGGTCTVLGAIVWFLCKSIVDVVEGIARGR